VLWMEWSTSGKFRLRGMPLFIFLLVLLGVFILLFCDVMMLIIYRLKSNVYSKGGVFLILMFFKPNLWSLWCLVPFTAAYYCMKYVVEKLWLWTAKYFLNFIILFYLTLNLTIWWFFLLPLQSLPQCLLCNSKMF